VDYQKTPLKSLVEGLASDIGLLYKLSNRIRKASRAQNTKAAKAFKILNDEGINVENFLKSQFAHIIQDRFPHVRGYLSTRLVDTMLLRRKRILYRRSRYSNTPLKFQQQSADHLSQFHSIGGYSAPQLGLDDPGPNAGPLASTVHKVSKSQAATATTLAADGLRKFSPPSVVSVARTVALADHEELVFPSPPVGYKRLKSTEMRRSPQGDDSTPIYTRNLDGEIWTSTEENEMDIEVICLFCFFALSSLVVSDEKKWRSVLLQARC
jgi:hypothetical protein